VVALTESVVSAAEVGAAGDDFAVLSEEGGPLLGKRLHTWSGQQLSKSRSIYNNFLLTTFPL
jgi:hypothetical protein